MTLNFVLEKSIASTFEVSSIVNLLEALTSAFRLQSLSFINNALTIVGFIHLSSSCAYPQLTHSRTLFSASKGMAELHFLQKRYVTFPLPSAGQQTVLR